MIRIRHLVLAATLAVVAIVPAAFGCTQPAVPTSAISTAEVVAQTAATVVADAQAVWPIVYAAIPAAQQPAAQDAFSKAVFAANHAILALDDAVQAAVAADNPKPDFTAIFAQLSDAVAQVVSIVKNFQGASPAVSERVRTTGGVDAVVDLSAASDRLRAVAAKK